LPFFFSRPEKGSRGTSKSFPRTSAGNASRSHRDETHFPAIEDPSCAHARLSCPHEDRRRPQGPVGASGEGPRAAVGLTDVEQTRRGGSARYRLRGAKAFEALFRRGTRHDAEFLQLIAAPAAQVPGRVGFVIARKAMRRAVDRNRLRRKLREAVRAARPAIEAFDLILRVRRSVARDEIGSAAAEGPRLLAKLSASR
jgi:ribonuclease P protein component